MHRTVFVFIFVFISVFSNAQKYYAKNYGVKSRLPSDAIRAIFKDKEGFIWIGTDAGVSKFNGKKFKTYTSSDGFSGDMIWSITQDKKGAMWFACYNGGVNKSENGKITAEGTEKNIPDINVRKIYYSEKFDCILAGADNALSVFFDDTLVNFSPGKIKDDKGNIIKRMQVTDFLETDSFIYVYTYAGNTTYKFFPESKTLKPADKTDRLCQKFPVSGVFVSSKHDTLISYRRKGIEVFKKDTSFIFENIGQVFSFSEDNEKNVWFSAWAYTDMEEPGGIFRYDGKNCRNFSADFGIKDRLVFSTFYDKEQEILWAGTVKNGLFAIPSPYFEYIRLPDEDTKINRLFTDAENKLWCASDKGIFIVKNDKIVKKINNTFFLKYKEDFCRANRINKNFAEKPFNVFSFFADFENNIYAATNIGIFRFNLAGKLTGRYNISSDYREHYVFISPDLLVKSGWDRLYYFRLKDNKMTRIRTAYDQSGIDASRFLKDGKKIWESTTTNGLNLFVNDTIINFNVKNSEIKTDMLTDVCIDNKGNIITSSANDRIFIYKYSGKKLKLIKTISKKDGIVGNSIRNMVCSKENLVFINTNLGLNVFDLNAFYDKDSVEIRFFDNTEGLGGTSYTSPVFNANGDLYFASGNKIVKFRNRKKAIFAGSKLRVKQTGFMLNFKDTLLSEIKKQGDVFIFRHFENNAAFNFDVLNFLNPEKDLFAYRLYPHQKYFTEFTKIRKASFFKLPPGNYVFEVISKNINTNKFAKPLKIKFKILKPWYNTLWFYILVTVFFVGIISTAIFLRFKKINADKKQQIELNKRIAETEMRALQSQMNPHFVFNAITAIQNYILGQETEKANNYLGYFAGLLRKTLNNASKKHVTLEEELNYLQNYISIEKMRFSETFEVIFKTDKKIDKKTCLIPPMLIQPLIENSIKHGKVHTLKHGKIIVEFKRAENDILLCSVSDNGVGFKKSAENKIHRIKTSKGLNIVKERINLLNKKYGEKRFFTEIISDDNKTVVKLYLPFINLRQDSVYEI